MQLHLGCALDGSGPDPCQLSPVIYTIDPSDLAPFHLLPPELCTSPAPEALPISAAFPAPHHAVLGVDPACRHQSWRTTSNPSFLSLLCSYSTYSTPIVLILWDEFCRLSTGVCMCPFAHNKCSWSVFEEGSRVWRSWEETTSGRLGWGKRILWSSLHIDTYPHVLFSWDWSQVLFFSRNVPFFYARCYTEWFCIEVYCTARCVSGIQETGIPKILLLVIPTWALFTQSYGFAILLFKYLSVGMKVEEQLNKCKYFLRTRASKCS